MTYDYHEPREVAEALHLLVKHGEDAHLIAGGTATVLLLRQGLIRPGHVISLRAIGALSGIGRAPDGGLRIGATATHRQAERSADVRALSPALTNAFASVATVRIRNQATVGGSLAHADPAQDPPPMLIALGGEAVVASKSGQRRIPLDEFFVDYFETALQPGEVLLSVDLPPLPAGTRVTYKKFLPRTQDDYATVSVAASLLVGTAGECEDIRVALGAAGPKPEKAALLPLLAEFTTTFTEAMVRMAAGEASSRLPMGERMTLGGSSKTSEAKKFKIFDDWRNFLFQDNVNQATKRGVRYAGMGFFHLQFLIDAGLDKKQHPFDMTSAGKEMTGFKGLTARLKKAAKKP